MAASANGRDELIVSYKEHVRGFEPDTGSELWNCVGVQDYVVPCVVVHDGIAYVLGGRKNQSMAIRLGGDGNITESHRIWATNIGANVTSPVYHEGHLSTTKVTCTGSAIAALPTAQTLRLARAFIANASARQIGFMHQRCWPEIRCT